jgi:hypothetical protein
VGLEVADVAGIEGLLLELGDDGEEVAQRADEDRLRSGAGRREAAGAAEEEGGADELEGEAGAVELEGEVSVLAPGVRGGAREPAVEPQQRRDVGREGLAGVGRRTDHGLLRTGAGAAIGGRPGRVRV